LVSFTGKGDLLTILHTLVNARLRNKRLISFGVYLQYLRNNQEHLQDFKHLAFRNDLFTMASGATILLIDDLTFTTALVAGLLDLLYHWTHLAKSDLDTLAVAVSASLNCTLFAATAVTLGANDMLLQSELGSFAHIKIFKTDLETVGDIFATTGSRGLSAATTTAKHTTTE
jgi:hypothetical protein